MMPPKRGQKRKHTSTHLSSPSVRKKSKSTSSTATFQQPDSSLRSDPDQWQVRAIINQQKFKGRLQYLVDWEPHPVTGETYPPEWKFRKDVGAGLLEDWKQEKERRQKVALQAEQSEQTATPEIFPSGEATGNSEVQQKVQHQGREGRVIDGPSQPEPTPPRPGERRPQDIQKPLRKPASLSDSGDSPLFEPSSEPKSSLNVEDANVEGLPIPQVHVTQKPEFDRGEYQIGSSQALPSRSSAPPLPLDDTSPVAVRFGSQTVVPDSQSLAADSSIITTRLGSVSPPSPPGLIEKIPSSSELEALPNESTSRDNTIIQQVPVSSAAVFETDPIEASSPALIVPSRAATERHSPPVVPSIETSAPEAKFQQLKSTSPQSEIAVQQTQPSVAQPYSPNPQPLVEDLITVLGQTPSATSISHHNRDLDSIDLQEAQVQERPPSATTTGTPSFSEQLRDQLQSTQPLSPISASQRLAQILSPRPELSSSSAPHPPESDSDSFGAGPFQHLQTPFVMPETRRSLRASGPPTSTIAGSSKRGSSSTSSQSAKNLRSIRAEEAAKRKERDEKQQRELAALKEKHKREKEAREAEEQAAAAALSASNSQDSETQDSAIPAEDDSTEPMVPHDANGNAMLPARMPTEGNDDVMKTNSLFSNEDMERRTQSGNQSSSESDSGEDIPGPPLDQMEFIVPVPMASNARDQYSRTVTFKKELVEKFTSRNWSQEASVLPEAMQFVQNMRDITTHIDLTNDTTSSQAAVEAELVVQWDRDVSTKFKFLHHLLEAVRGQDLHLIIVSQPGKLLDILQKFLQGSKIDYFRADNQERANASEVKGSLLVTLLPSTGEGSSAVSRSANVMLTLDHVIDVNDPRIRELRQHATQADKMAPVVSLVVVNSVDHIDRSIMPSLTGTQRLRVLVRCIAKLRKEAGKTDSGSQSIEENAMDVARFVLMRGAEDQWPLARIGPLDNSDAWDLSQGLTTMKSAASSDSGNSAKAKAALKSAQKRRLDQLQDDKGESSKKIRMTPQADNDASTTRISDSLAAGSSQVNRTPTNSDEITALQSMLKATEGLLQGMSKETEQLEEAGQAKDGRIQEFESALSELQFRFEEQTAEKRILATKLAEANTALELVQTQYQSRLTTIDIVREEIRDLRAQLSEARLALQGSSIPEIAAMEKLRQEKEQAEEARKKAERQVASLNNTLEYVNKSYGEAGARVFELDEENRAQASKIAALEKTASGEINRARQLNLGEQQKRNISENVQLRREVKNLTDLLRRKEDELRTRKSGIGTRAGSVPRSPRVGPTSRAGSPIPDHRRIGALKSNANLQAKKLPLPKSTPQEVVHNEPANNIKNAAPIIAEPKPRAHKPIEMKTLENKPVEPKPPVSRPPEPIPPAPRPQEHRTTGPSSRPFPCCFAQYNCGSAFTSKNEWKRHISTKHIQLGFWRCDMCPPSPGIDHPVYNDFNRKDLFTQHLRRMHAVPAALTSQDDKEPLQPAQSIPASSNTPAITDEQIAEIQKRCYRILRTPPEVSSCVFCSRKFAGPNSWEERLEHVGGHLERDRKNGTTCLDVSAWLQDPPLRDYLLVEGLVETDPRGGFRIGDGKPKRPVDIEGYAGQQPTAQLTPRANPMPPSTPNAALGQASAATDGDSEGSNDKRRRGRPPKRSSDAMDIDPPEFNSTNTPQSRPEQQLRPRPSPMQQYSLEAHNQPQQNHHHQPHPHHIHPQSHEQQQNHGHQQVHPHQQNHMQQHGHPHQQALPPPIPQAHPQQHPHNHLHSQNHHPQQYPHSELPMPSPDMRDPNAQNMPMAGGHQPGQIHMPAPANLQPMYEFRHGTFTKFQGTAPNLAPRPVQELPPPALSTRAHGQPQLAPKPSPDPRDGIAGRSPPISQQLAPKPPSQTQSGSVSPMAPAHHSGFKAINEPRTPAPMLSKGHVHVAPKPSQESYDGFAARSQDGGRQLAPKPPQSPIDEFAEGVVTRRQAAGTQRPTTPQNGQQAMSGAEIEERRRQTRGKSFREVVMS